ncbi:MULTISPECIES: MtrAB system histidine kinase MtrB [Aestuariimicrobium]|uniref:MtrAB system histidine kinase MtrB n=1 Tax=Aestuariimicrobium TaxID=396388 RepID=UPI0024815783|nr:MULTISPECIES: MtrAB system histidine kinase MtrB [Aestuariimicrobium]
MPLRVISSTVIGSIIVVLLSGWLIMRQATDGVMAGKRSAAIAEASSSLDRIQRQLRDTDLRTASLYERLNQLADEAGSSGSQFHIVIQGPVSGFVSPGIALDSVPQSLVDAVAADPDGMFVTPTTVISSDDRVAPIPGLAVGARLQAPVSGQSYPIYFIFPLNHEVQVLQVMQRALITTGALLLALMLGISALVSAHVVRPIRQASIIAGRLADGHLDERMAVRGTDDLASLATSMNHMASELQQQIVQLEDLSRVQQQFVSDVSHELRTPLTTVKMAAELLHDGREDFDPSVARTTELLYDELDRFEGLLGDLLEISRFDAGAAVLNLDEVDLVALVTAEVESQRPFAERAGTQLRLHAEGTAYAEVDARRIRRILRNLITNAIEHAEQLPIDITVKVDDEAVAIVVRDHGVGFLASQARQVFHRFWRADPSRTRTMGGTGLGLAISLEDAMLHEGWLSAWGRPKRGAQFRLTLPRRHGQVLRSSPLPLAPTDFTLVERNVTHEVGHP